MCRIAGIFDPSLKNLQEQVVAMRDAMHRGGPDDAGLFVHSSLPLALGHRRLSLIDLSEAGHQPMIDAELTIVFNGEIYNYLELRSTLQHYGHTFKTESDTEVILKAYRQWGVEAFEYFNGMFALALLDEKKQQLVLARDHAGIKPLYYYIDQHCLYFASEIRAFAKAEKVFEENEKWRSAFLTFGHLPEPITTLKHVIPLAKGTALVIDLPSLKKKVHRFFKWSFTGQLKNEDEALQLMRETLEQAVERHLIADAPIGLFLSGGIDSSLLTLIASHTRKDNLHTLSIVFNEKAFSEEKYQQLIIDKTGAKHQSFLVTKDIFNTQLEDAMLAMDQPTLDGINTYFISMYAKAYGLKAVLSGLGADELFGGYPSFQQQKKMKYVQRMPAALLRGMQRFPDHRIRKLSYAGMQNTAAEYLSYRGIFTPVSVASLLDTTEKEVEHDLIALSEYYPVSTLTNGNRVSWLETNFYMQNQLLKDSDFMSMWHGLEIRVPYLDKEVMLMAGAIDASIKFKTVPPKYVLVKSFEHELPEAIWKRKKQGFTFPFEGWLKENEFIKPSNNDEEQLYKKFQQKKLSWGRYWCALLMNRFERDH
ncbi:asparagine synthase (glutamine-hydrolyzing) [Lacibacter sediminis]|uniref:asparagine synthase (glutamine-hydrolyzing) n=1 Tax=Lacibacter sediminis TaxID=2760713 RepID=A0A7G5XHM1_9BACT|nr:asparagine synthase (glutamine-hydrolyzing) [Lacibacter sediminis]QNA44974.1 asparagine synthase (glutamine-hydrolyzing) [Lacibacter sediminis]